MQGRLLAGWLLSLTLPAAWCGEPAQRQADEEHFSSASGGLIQHCLTVTPPPARCREDWRSTAVKAGKAVGIPAQPSFPNSPKRVCSIERSAIPIPSCRCRPMADCRMRSSRTFGGGSNREQPIPALASNRSGQVQPVCRWRMLSNTGPIVRCKRGRDASQGDYPAGQPGRPLD